MRLQRIWQVATILLLVFVLTQPAHAATGDLSLTNNYDVETDSTIFVPGNANVSLQSAINDVPNNGIIQVSGGTYSSPSGGWTINSQTKSYTIQAAPNEHVILTGDNTHRIFDIGNSPQAHITFQDITFANGFNSGFEAAGVSISRSNITFVRCEFTGNHKTVYRTNVSAGSLFIEAGSTVFIFDSIFHDNISEDGGAGFSTRESTVYVHNTQFINNQNVSSNQLYNGFRGVSIGTGANIVNSKVRITNSQFRNNQATGHGAAIYIIGLWNNPTGSDVVISNSTFENNHIVRPFAAPEPESGGAINIEDQSRLKIYNSRFINNSAWMGGAISVFRAKTEIYDSVFIGNRATETTPSSGFGGAILLNFLDRPDFANLLIEDTLIQGKYPGINTVAQYGGGIHTHGNPTSNKPDVTLRRVILNDLDTTTTVVTKAALGGGLEISGVDFTMEDSIVMNCDAKGPRGGYGGGMIVYANTNVNILRSTFANNTADTYGGGISITGSQLNIDSTLFLKNDVSPGVTENPNYSYGAAIFSSPDFGLNKPMSGAISNSTFVLNQGIALYDDDRSPGPINSLVYNNNSFFETTYTGKVYNNKLATTQTPAGLNSLVISRSGSSTDKSPQNNNSALNDAPVVARLMVAPHEVLPIAAVGDSSTTTNSYLGYVWNGSSAKLDGASLSSGTGVQVTTTTGQHTLSVNNNQNTIVQLPAGPAPLLQTSIAPGSPLPSVVWNVDAGTFLSIHANQGLNLPNNSSGTTAVPSIDRFFSIYLTTREGGIVSVVDPRIPLLYAPDKITVLAGLNQAEKRGEVPIRNIGGLTMNWEASTITPSLIQIETGSGSTTSTGTIPFLILPTKAGTYNAQMYVDAGLAGTAEIAIEIILVEEVKFLYLPSILK